MKVALIPLAAAALVSWLIAGPFANLLEGVGITGGNLPSVVNHTTVILGKVISSPMTLVALVAIALGLAAWVWRERLQWLVRALRGVSQAASNSFGFEAINRGVIRAVQESAEALRFTQTGLLNWNVFAILLTLVVVLLIMIRGV